jgi:hypothetical protein
MRLDEQIQDGLDASSWADQALALIGLNLPPPLPHLPKGLRPYKSEFIRILNFYIFICYKFNHLNFHFI